MGQYRANMNFGAMKRGDVKELDDDDPMVEKRVASGALTRLDPPEEKPKRKAPAKKKAAASKAPVKKKATTSRPAKAAGPAKKKAAAKKAAPAKKAPARKAQPEVEVEGSDDEDVQNLRPELRTDRVVTAFRPRGG